MSDYKNDLDDSCEDIYSELPKEVVDVLMKTHPSMAKSDDGNSISMGDTNVPSSRNGDVFEVREARMQQVGSEISEIRKYPQMEGDPTRYVTKQRDVNEGLDNINVVLRATKEVSNMSNNDDTYKEEFEEDIQFVSVVPNRNKNSDSSTNSASTNDGQKRKRKSQNDNDMNSQFEDIDFYQREKQDQLDNLYNDNDNYYEEDTIFNGKEKFFTIAFGVGIVAILALCYRTTSLSTSLSKAETELAASAEISSKYESLQLENMNLQEQLNQYVNPDSGNSTTYDDTSSDGSSSSASTGTDTPASSADSGVESSDLSTTTVYTVVAGDNGWSISQRVYGDGTKFREILAANNLSEGDTLSVGMKLTIPR